MSTLPSLLILVSVASGPEVEVFPERVNLRDERERMQLVVTAVRADETVDRTRSAEYETGDPAIVATPSGPAGPAGASPGPGTTAGSSKEKGTLREESVQTVVRVFFILLLLLLLCCNVFNACYVHAIFLLGIFPT